MSERSVLEALPGLVFAWVTVGGDLTSGPSGPLLFHFVLFRSFLASLLITLKFNIFFLLNSGKKNPQTVLSCVSGSINVPSNHFEHVG